MDRGQKEIDGALHESLGAMSTRRAPLVLTPNKLAGRGVLTRNRRFDAIFLERRALGTRPPDDPPVPLLRDDLADQFGVRRVTADERNRKAVRRTRISEDSPDSSVLLLEPIGERRVACGEHDEE